MPERLHMVIKGRVQGVGFRYSAYRQAQSLGLVGWVRNRSDGTVEAEFEGTRGALDSMLDWAKEGPPLARVIGIDASRYEDLSGYSDIEIR
ncbi:MAG: acylphosphatase [Candidatus Hydrogenedentes bacterium]|nr:acylphosphatase [Candidatus Hydrogenedentota bacterium]